ncbi:MAG: hypothetical protein CM15mV40_310 [Caudoviricetes sp.]|nr:MAG: hypothetical protein CM15mV40_310 [Caudoviricetes sp.]
MASTAKYYRQNREARLRRLKQQRKYNKTKKGLALRVNANRLNRQLGTYGNGDNKDAAHYKGSTTKGRLQSPSENRKSRLKIRK